MGWNQGSDPANGLYLPFEDVQLDDLVTVHTGTGQWDYNEATFPVAAITISLREGGDWDAWYDLGSTYTSMAERAFQARGAPAHSHPPNPELCRPGSADTVLYDLDFEDLTLGGPGSTVSPVYPSGSGTWPDDSAPLWSDTNPVGQGGSGKCIVWGGAFGTGSDARSPKLPATVGQTYRWSAWAWLGSALAPADVLTVVFYDASDVALATYTLAAAVPQSVWTHYTADYTAPANTAYMRLVPLTVPDNAGAYDTVTVTVLTGTVGDTPQPVGANDEGAVGTSNRATRCDHVHAHSDLSDHSDEIHHHADSILGLTTGAPTDATYLVTTANGTLTNEVVVGATPGGELGGTWASPTVDAVHSGSAHLALGTTAGTAAEGDHTHTASRGELLMQDGVTAPPVPIETEARDDWLYEG